MINVAITGHRPNKLDNDYDLVSPLIQAIKARIIEILTEISQGLFTIQPITGMALGIDTLYALIAIELELPFIAAIPCEGQSSIWPEKAQKRYLDLINHHLCIKQYTALGKYTSQKMQIRNEWMVDNCDVLIAVWDGTPGGTANCVRYAQSKNKIIIFIDPNIIRNSLVTKRDC